MFNNALAAMMPTIEKLFRVRRTVLEAGPDTEAIRAIVGLPRGKVVRIDGEAEGTPFVVYFAIPAPTCTCE